MVKSNQNSASRMELTGNSRPSGPESRDPARFREKHSEAFLEAHCASIALVGDAINACQFRRAANFIKSEAVS